MSNVNYIEEEFGILTDDELYLDCTLVKPTNMRDEDLRSLRVWVPKYPLTQTSTITCARQEVDAKGPDGRVAHLVFDLRGTGYSDAKDQNYRLDLLAIKAWAEERFAHNNLNLTFFGYPESKSKQISLLPLRPGVVMETYAFPAAGMPDAKRPSILYLATYGQFNSSDDTLCYQLARAGYNVYGIDPLRYLLHASINEKITPKDLWQDLHLLRRLLPSAPIIIGQPISAGLALAWAVNHKDSRGVIAIGQAQIAFKPSHIFDNANPHNFLLTRYVGKIAPWGNVLVQLTKHPLGGSTDEIGALHQTSNQPRRLESVPQVTPQLLIQWLEWLQNNPAN
ncbi:MAG TPA: hypothetical protein VLL52_00395 [Anaerolineae bacterium]|nr:hypothetical protein [Anaerolineae bacterium]